MLGRKNSEQKNSQEFTLIIEKLEINIEKSQEKINEPEIEPEVKPEVKPEVEPEVELKIEPQKNLEFNGQIRLKSIIVRVDFFL